MSGNKSYSNSLSKDEVVLRIPSTDNVTLEARLFVSKLRRRETLVILAHPYGPLGGNCQNPVIHSLFTLFATLGFSTLRLNFRGAGDSTGKASYQGQGEIDDVLAVYKFMKSRSESTQQPPVKSVILVGYSYGAISISAAAKHIPDVIASVLISYPVSMSWALTLGNGKKYLEAYKSAPQHPKLLLMGSNDNFTSKTAFESFCSGLPDPKSVVVVAGCDHFWAEFEENLMGLVRQWISKLDVFNAVASPVVESPVSPLSKTPLPKSSISALRPSTVTSPTQQQPLTIPTSQGDKKRYSLGTNTLTDTANLMSLTDAGGVTESETTLTSKETLAGTTGGYGKPPAFVPVSLGAPVQQRPSRPPPPVPGNQKGVESVKMPGNPKGIESVKYL
jgi:alpha/beta superfamily hydrolase